MKYQKEILPVIEPKDVFTGSASAPITITEFGDYESEACAKAHEVVKQLLETYDGKVKFVFRHFPLTKIHQKAHKAAEAAIAAAQEGKFWEMHEELFANRRNLGVISLKSYAKEIGTTNKRFLDDLINGTYGWNVQGDLMEGLEKGVRDIPAFFINNQKLEGDPTFKNLSKAIETTMAEGKLSSIHPKRKSA
ncbi:DsbA family protein [Flavisolibacter tropicus]|uniref:DSBA oxidoreductase n=1 Tax=Flavisolibacter tropicus TaxID=1492898 RepID=A0A172U0U1_9BACT|nr:thioredoxin domain-containing protein [Flavisolibacter tropicus]ANE52971.1 DSBA oxidoreductase [Flavisolibacter tropicus]